MSLAGRTGLLAGLALALLVSACARQPGPSNAFVGPRPEPQVRLTVSNNDFRDASIYAYWSGLKRRVGMVTGKSEKTFEFPWQHEELQLEVDFIGGGGWVSERVPVWDGDHIDFVIQPCPRCE